MTMYFKLLNIFNELSGITSRVVLQYLWSIKTRRSREFATWMMASYSWLHWILCGMLGSVSLYGMQRSKVKHLSWGSRLIRAAREYALIFVSRIRSQSGEREASRSLKARHELPRTRIAQHHATNFQVFESWVYGAAPQIIHIDSVFFRMHPVREYD